MLMAKLPVVSSLELIKCLQKVGFEVDHVKGSHFILRSSGGTHLTVPKRKVLGKGLLLKIIIKAGLTKEQFCLLLGKKL